MTARILVVDDEKPLREFISRNLSARGFQVTQATNGLEALGVFQSQPLDLIILDLMMPRLDGLEVTQRVRRSSQVPIIVLSALDEEHDKVLALDLGADDYLTKPFGVEELLARVRAALRRAGSREPHPPAAGIRLGSIHLQPERGQVLVEGRALRLTRTEFELLHFLMQHAGKVLTHRRILQQVWGPEYGEESEYLRVYIGRLRRKIENDPANPVYLLTEHGVGYRFEERGSLF